MILFINTKLGMGQYELANATIKDMEVARVLFEDMMKRIVDVKNDTQISGIVQNPRIVPIES